MLDADLLEKLVYAMSPYVTSENYGKYTICNLYLDTDDYALVRNSIERPVFKEKLRLRSYGTPTADSNVFLEIKRKYKGVVAKRRIGIPLWEAEGYIEEGILPSDSSQIFREIDWMMKYYRPAPKLFLAYDRIAVTGVTDKSFRITFDRNIRSRQDDLRLGHGSEGELLLDKSVCVMEIKTNAAAIPLWLSGILSGYEIYPASFSKYGTVYKQKIWSEYYV